MSNVPHWRPDDLARAAGPAAPGVVDGWLVIDAVITTMLRETMPDAEVRVYDMTGTMDHLEVFVKTKAFQGVSPLDRHRMVEKALAPARADGRIHALQIRTATPEDTNG
jgi:stress-induced morphogen